MIEILSLGLNNLNSIRHAFSEVTSSEVRVIETAEESNGVGLLVLPGTGHFAAGMREVNRRGFGGLLSGAMSSSSRPIFGVCLGMQMLFEASEEAPDTPGLGFVRGKIVKLGAVPECEDRVPRVGWSELKASKKSAILKVANNRDVYFAHSFGSFDSPETDETLETSFCGRQILAGFALPKVAGFQFHPERSSTVGRDLLRKIVRWADCEN